MDQQGRILIHPFLRDKAEIDGEVAVLGQQNYLEVWNRARFDEQLETRSADRRGPEGHSPTWASDDSEESRRLMLSLPQTEETG